MTLDQLKLMNNFRSSHFKLMTNLNLSTEPNWLPIGDATTKFTGSFDGNGFGLDNLTINALASPNLGFFGFVDGATIQNVTLTNISFLATGNYAGGLIGTVTGATVVTNCSVTGSIAASQAAGGMIGQADAGSSMAVSDSWTNVAIDSDNYGSLGGLVGYTLGGSIQRCYALGSITESSVVDVDYVGGLVGFNTETSITNSYARGNVTGTNFVGGLVGRNSGTGTEDIINCYSAGSVSGTTSIGGLVGENAGVGIVQSSYYDSDITGLSESGKGTPLTTAVMKSAATHATTYSGWDFATIWDAFVDGSYPTLR
jgi:hypothetical protein